MGSPPHQAEPARAGHSGERKAEEGEEGEEPEQQTKKPRSKAQGRKRTKTGCLTCRRRRIKCGEERPTCQNCTKSKRQCEGYNQRVVFKDPLNPYRGPPISSHVQFSEPTPAVRHGDTFQPPSSGAGPLPIAPKPSGNFSSFVFSQEADAPLPAVTSPGVERRVYGFHGDTDLNYTPTTTHGQHSYPAETLDLAIDTVDRSHVPEPRAMKTSQDQATHYDFEALEAVKQESRGTPVHKSPLEWSSGPSRASLSSPQEILYDSNSQLPVSAGFYQVYPSSSNWQPPSTASSSVAPPHATTTPSTTDTLSPRETTALKSEQTQHYQDRAPQLQQENFHVSPQEDNGDWKQPMGIQMFQDYYPEDENDPYDVSDEEKMEEQTDDEDELVSNQDLHLRNNDLGLRVALQARQEIQNLSIRTITSHIDRPNMLASYIPSSQASPLRDPMTARIFCHFINVTGPTMSMFERHPANPSLIFQGQPVPRSQQHIWTYTFPTLALRNQGLLHAMLAVASLHIAKLQNGSLTASLKHYAFGLRRVAKSISLPTRRGHPATLAAAMLLAFYECWGAEHQKWSNHLLGARMLVKEIDFAGMTKHIRAMKLRQRVEQRLRDYHNDQQHVPHAMYDNMGQPQRDTNEVDENIVSMLMGRMPQYDQYGRILEDNTLDDGGDRVYTEQDMEIYETQRDLFWWYAKQDTYQSILGGGRLFMEYNRWINCPPRAPLGRLSATYGTFDHLILLMGRLADFASKDVKRKRLAMKANGGYRPPGMPPMQQGQQGPPPQMPPFNGMVPDVGEAQLPMGFEPSVGQSPQSNHSGKSEDMDLDAARIEAEEEWQEIRNAFSVIADHFGEDFQALGPEYAAPIETPFGSALVYRTYGIAGIWLNYYMALIQCHRVHPSMPPAAMMASGIAARHTEFFANEIGRIAAGIAPECGMQAEVSPGVGAAIIESGTALFIAAVQYQNNTQRHWTVDRLRDIARLTGWQTALAICTGIETSWVKVAELGKGPPYVRTSDDRIIPDRWHNYSSRRLDRTSSSFQGEGRMVLRRSDRVHYAMGILTMDADFDTFDLDNDDER